MAKKELVNVEKDAQIVKAKETVQDVLIEDLSTQEAVDNFVRGLIPESFAKDYKKLKKLQDELSKTEASIKEKLIEMFEAHPEMNSQTVTMDGLSFTYTKSYVKNTVDSKKLQEEYPDIYKKMIKTSNVKSSIKTSVKF